MLEQATLPSRTNPVDTREVGKFSAQAERWWDPRGPFAPLHALHPSRMRFIVAEIAERFGRDLDKAQPFAGLRMLDVGCGGGLVSESLARLGAEVSGIDASAESIAVARNHAAQSQLDIAYHATTLEDWRARDDTNDYDVVLALELIEHLQDPAAFMVTLLGSMQPNGLALVSTINRNPKSFALAILGAEYILRWLPRGTHQWQRFVRPQEIEALAEAANAYPQRFTGLRYNPLLDHWVLTGDLSVNYMASLYRYPAANPGTKRGE